MQNTKGKLYLIPTPLAEDGLSSIPATVIPVLEKTDHYIVENIKTARRFIRSVLKSKNLDVCVFEELDKHADYLFNEHFLQHALDGKDIGLLSEAGMPCIADPGNKVVSRAHEMGIAVVPLAGPSSILMALTGSGFNGQQFTFNGYLPIEPKERKNKLQQMEVLAKKGITQIFMDTPYRNQKLLEEILHACQPGTMLCIACDLTGRSEFIKTWPVADWKKQKTDLHKKPAVFLFGI
jgi:16S rRNA (cytidine1402-2'-O)-methyltransferase